MTKSERKRILYIEDDPGLARLVQKRLGKKGYSVDIASDGEEGIAKYQADSYDLLFVDQELPIHDGLEIIRILASSGSLPPTVMITGTGNERVAVEAMKLGASDYIVKDVEGGYLELLPSIIEKLLQQRRAAEEKQRVEKELQESEERYRMLVDNIDLGINLIDADHNIVMANADRHKHFNRSVDDLIGEKCFRVFEKRDAICPYCPGVQAMATGRPAEAETVGVRDDGGRFNVRIQAFPCFGDDGTVTGFIEISENITERKQAEEDLRIKDNAIASSNTAIAIAEFGGNLTYVNPEFLKMWGYKDENEVLGKPAVNFWHMNKKAGKIVRTILNEKRVIGELQAKKKDGSLFDIHVSASTVANEHGKPVWMMASCIDITERKEVEQALMEHKQALQNSFFGTAEALSKVIEDRDPYTSGHSAGVAGLAEAIARVMGFSGDQITGVYIAGLLHDIGKMAVPVEVLVKPGRLTDMEMSLIQRHPEAGYEILKGIDFPWPVGQATFHHHERMDGSGYPQGLKGDSIILEARILAVADVVDAMTHHRPYRPAFSVQDAMEEISKGRRRFYDPQVVDACLEVLEGGEAFTSSVYSMSSTSPQLRRGSTKPSVLPTTTMMRFSGRR